mgnify:CR=1 FL=1
MQLLDAIKEQQQKVARLERHLALEKLKARKSDTRRKIEFGGLVIKSKIDKYSKAVILGALIDALESIERDASYEKLFKAKAEAVFMEFKNNT